MRGTTVVSRSPDPAVRPPSDRQHPIRSGGGEELAVDGEPALAGVDVRTVPGALEVPGVIVKAHRTARYDGYVALGVVLRGETTHYDIVAGETVFGV